MTQVGIAIFLEGVSDERDRSSRDRLGRLATRRSARRPGGRRHGPPQVAEKGSRILRTRSAR
jgi:hypothetical protein